MEIKYVELRALVLPGRPPLYTLGYTHTPAGCLLCGVGKAHPDRAERPACPRVERLLPSWIWGKSQGARNGRTGRTGRIMEGEVGTEAVARSL